MIDHRVLFPGCGLNPPNHRPRANLVQAHSVLPALPIIPPDISLRERDTLRPDGDAEIAPVDSAAFRIIRDEDDSDDARVCVGKAGGRASSAVGT